MKTSMLAFQPARAVWLARLAACMEGGLQQPQPYRYDPSENSFAAWKLEPCLLHVVREPHGRAL